MLRTPLPLETPALVALGVSTGLFSADEAQSLLGHTLDTFHTGDLGEGHRVEVWTDGVADVPVGWVYYAPDDHADGVWNLWWIGVAPALHGRGVGQALMAAVERRVRDAGGRILIVETSSLPTLARTREFYRRRGYSECGQVPDFYAEGDAKVVFAKGVARTA